MKIYTKGGDKGETGLFGGKRVPKDLERIEAYGTIDELNSFIALAVLEIKDIGLRTLLEKLQNYLFVLGADLSTPETEENKKFNIPRITQEYCQILEKEIDYFDSLNDELKNFIIPGGDKGAVKLHVCRTICRRAERRVVTLSKKENIGENIVIFLNRLSDLFFVIARYQNKISGIDDIKWISPP
jgi:cob(I)alamin adenosyltransferase